MTQKKNLRNEIYTNSNNNNNSTQEGKKKNIFTFVKICSWNFLRFKKVSANGFKKIFFVDW